MRSVVGLCLCAFFSVPPSRRRKIFDDAARALAAGDYQTAERGFQAVLREQPRNIAALSNLGVIYSRTNRADQAIAIYRRALQVSPDDKAILLNLGLVYLRQEAHSKALPLFDRIVAIDPAAPAGPAVARRLPRLCRSTGAGDSRSGSAARGRPSRRRDSVSAGIRLSEEPRLRKARRAIFQQMFEAAGPVRAQFLLGKAYYEATLFPQAEESFLEVLRLDPAVSRRAPGIGQSLHQPTPHRGRDPRVGSWP